MQKLFIVGLLSILLIVLFALKNSAPITIDFVFGKPVEGTPLSLVLLVAIGIGIFVGLLFSYPIIKKLRHRVANKKEEITKLKKIINEYKNKVTEQ